MQVEFDPAKDAANVEKHGVSLALTAELDIVAVVESNRPQDRERRFRLYGLIGGDLHCAVVTYREASVRAISLRRANRTERKRHGFVIGH
ncbi:MAG TPA: BrnT family toxin [Allosphingosinicella sp.]